MCFFSPRVSTSLDINFLEKKLKVWIQHTPMMDEDGDDRNQQGLNLTVVLRKHGE